ncbi:hypothetical protein KC351_g14491 [Hortaea werneckii]|nr:hypothetical protein KC351_g14491 [Hortaea werneckii]
MSTSKATPISPVVQTANPALTTPSASASHDEQPVELDATSSSPERIRRNSRPWGLGDLSPEERDKRVAMRKQRENDPAVLVDLPKTPQAAELEKVGAMGKEG